MTLDNAKGYTASEINKLIKDVGGEMSVSFNGTISGQIWQLTQVVLV